jgi:hypothetical protein
MSYDRSHCITSSVNEETIKLTKACLKAIYPFISSLARSEQYIKWNSNPSKAQGPTSTSKYLIQIENELRKWPSRSHFFISCKTREQWRSLLVFDITVLDFSYGGL